VWEVRSSLDNREARVLFVAKNAEMVLLHGFFKKTNATPGEDLQLAERRWKEWQDQEKGEKNE
jgi:phage-related protein